MRIYLNPDNLLFQKCLNSEIYVDKTGLIEQTNRILNTKNKLLCVSRPRRFGKSMALEMLAAYYSKGCNSRKLKVYEAISKSKQLLEATLEYGETAVASAIEKVQKKYAKMSHLSSL